MNGHPHSPPIKLKSSKLVRNRLVMCRVSSGPFRAIFVMKETKYGNLRCP